MDTNDKLHREVILANQKLHNSLGELYEKDPLIEQQFSSHSKSRMKEVLETAIKARKRAGEKTALVDIGTGTGLALDIAKDMTDISIGFDVALEMLKVSRKRGHSVSLADGANLPLQDKTADIVIIDSVLHHVLDIKKVIGEAYRILKPGGVLVTDWDPNGLVQITQAKPLYKALLYMSKKIRYTLGGFSDQVKRDVFEMAEYHRFHDNLLPDKINGCLCETGFSEVKIIYHANHKSANNLSLFSMPAISFVRTIILMILGLTFDKKKIYEIIMTVSVK